MSAKSGQTDEERNEANHGNLLSVVADLGLLDLIGTYVVTLVLWFGVVWLAQR